MIQRLTLRESLQREALLSRSERRLSAKAGGSGLTVWQFPSVELTRVENVTLWTKGDSQTNFDCKRTYRPLQTH